MKKAFSLIELMVVIAVSATLMLVTANFLISTIRQNNQVTIENEIRNEGNFLMEQIISDIRKSACVTPGVNSIYLSQLRDCSSGTVYSVSNNNLTKNSVVINSGKVKVRSCGPCACNNSTPGLIIEEAPVVSGQKPIYDVTLNLTQAKDSPRSDFCGKITIKESVQPRN